MKKSLIALTLAAFIGTLSSGCDVTGLIDAEKLKEDIRNSDINNLLGGKRPDNDQTEDTTNNSDSDDKKDDNSAGTSTGSALSANVKLTNINQSNCSEEKNLKSERNSTSSRFTFKNESSQRLKFYWLDFEGKRVLYNNTNAGATYNQNTFVNHYWVITDQSDNCVGIFAANNATANLTVDNIVGSTVTSPDNSDSGDDVKAMIECLKQKNPEAASFYDSSYESYLLYKNSGNAEITASARTSIEVIANQFSCL